MKNLIYFERNLKVNIKGQYKPNFQIVKSISEQAPGFVSAFTQYKS